MLKKAICSLLKRAENLSANINIGGRETISFVPDDDFYALIETKAKDTRCLSELAGNVMHK